MASSARRSGDSVRDASRASRLGDLLSRDARERCVHRVRRVLPACAVPVHLMPATIKNLRSASGNTTVPMSRPSRTIPPSFPISRCSRTIASRTSALTADGTDGARHGRRPDGFRHIFTVQQHTQSLRRTASIAHALRAATQPPPTRPRVRYPARRTLRVTARYIAPVSTCTYPSRPAASRAVVLFPEAAGPSIAITNRRSVTGSFSREKRIYENDRISGNFFEILPGKLYLGHSLWHRPLKKLTHDEISSRRLSGRGDRTMLPASRSTCSWTISGACTMSGRSSGPRTEHGYRSCILTGFTPHPAAEGDQQDGPGSNGDRSLVLLQGPSGGGGSLKREGSEDLSRGTDGWKPPAHLGRSLTEFPLCLLIGNELTGVSPALVEAADMAIEIPMFGAKQSLERRRRLRHRGL